MTYTLTGHDVEDGELPEGWEVRELRELVDVLDSLRKPVNRKERADRAGDVPYYGATGQVGTIDEALFDEDLVLLGEDGVQFFDPDKKKAYEISGPAWVNNHAHVLRCNQDIYQQSLLVHFLNQADYRNRANGTTRLKLTQAAMKEIPVLTPPRDEQERIVEILEEQLARLDTALESVHTVREKAAQFRRSLLHAAFTGALTGHDVQEGELPEGWVANNLVEAAEVVMGQSPPGSTYNENGAGMPFFQGKAEFGALHPSVRKWTTAGKRFAQVGDILMSVRAPVGPTNLADVDCVIGRGLAAIQAREHVDQAFLLWNLRHFEDEIAARGTGTTFDSISGGALRSQNVNIPPLLEQERIVEILEEQLARLDASLAVADAVEERSAALRRSLLHSAFTGRLTEEWREAVNV